MNPRGLQEGLRALAQGGTPARLLIIDDGWQQMGGRQRSRGQMGKAGPGWAECTPLPLMLAVLVLFAPGMFCSILCPSGPCRCGPPVQERC